MTTKSITILDSEYKQWIASLSQRYRRCQLKAAVKVNSEMLQFYWSLGRDIVEMHVEERWGDGLMACLSRDLKQEMPDVKSFSTTNLYYIKKLYLFYNEYVKILPQAGVKFDDVPEYENLPQVGVNLKDPITSGIMLLPWGHHKLLIDRFFKKREIDEAFFYIQKSIQDGWSRSMLLN